MREVLLKAYHALPSPGRNVIASLRGHYLRRWRYGSESSKLTEEAISREQWNPQQWSGWTDEKLQRILLTAATQVPFYREIWEEQKGESRKQTEESGKQKVESRNERPQPSTINPSNSQPSSLNSQLSCGADGGWKNLRNWPVLKKAALRNRPEAFVAEGCVRRRMFCEHTSGSTGTPLTLWQSRKTVQAWYALFEARWRRWYGLSRHDRWAILGGQLVTPANQQRPPFWAWNSGLNQLYLSSYHLRPENAAAYVQAMGDHEVIYLLGYASSLTSLARDILDQGLKPPALRAAISNAEPLLTHQREIIHRAFGCRVYDTYGMSEMVCAASECEHGRMHLWPEVGIWEVLRDDSDEPVAPGDVGRLVCTGLLNTDMPLIRYEVGDRVAIAEPGAVCECGRTLPILKSIEGRNDDTIITPSGRRIGRLDPVFKSGLKILEAQIVQDSPDHLILYFVPAPGCNGATESYLESALAERTEGMRIDVRKVTSIARGPNGKFKAVLRLPF